MSILLPCRQSSKTFQQKSYVNTTQIRKLSNNISLIENSLIEPIHYRKNKFSTLDVEELLDNKLLQNQENQQGIICAQNAVPLQDAKQMISQLLAKGKKITNMYKNSLNTYKSNQVSQLITQFQNQAQKNQYLNSACRHILIEYYQLRKIGLKLRGLNSDLLNQIENKIYSLFQTEFKLWLIKKQKQKCQNLFYNQLENFLQNNQRKFQVIIN